MDNPWFPSTSGVFFLYVKPPPVVSFQLARYDQGKRRVERLMDEVSELATARREGPLQPEPGGVAVGAGSYARPLARFNVHRKLETVRASDGWWRRASRASGTELSSAKILLPCNKAGPSTEILYCTICDL